MRMIHGLLLGGALVVAAGAIPAAASDVVTTRPLSDYSSMQVETPYGVQAFNPDGYQLRVQQYETLGHVGSIDTLNQGRAATTSVPPGYGR